MFFFSLCIYLNRQTVSPCLCFYMLHLPTPSLTTQTTQTHNSPQLKQTVTAVRPLGSSAGNGYPQQFPHDMARECEAASRKTRIQTQGNERALLSW